MSKYYFGENTTVSIEALESFNKTGAVYIVRSTTRKKVLAVAVTVRFKRRKTGYTVKLLHFITFDKDKDSLVEEFVKYLTEEYGANTYGLELTPELYEGNKKLEDMGFYLPLGRDDIYYRVIDKGYRAQVEKQRNELIQRREMDAVSLEILRKPTKDASGKKICWIMLNKEREEILLRAETALKLADDGMHLHVAVPEMYCYRGFLHKLIQKIMTEYKDVADKIEVPVEVYGQLEDFVFYKHFQQSLSDSNKYVMDMPDKLWW